MNNFFWNTLYNRAYSVYKSEFANAEPTKFTIIFNDNARTVVQYIDLESRKLKSRMVNRILDSNFGAIIIIVL